MATGIIRAAAYLKQHTANFPGIWMGSNGFADVEDTARAIIALMNSGIRNERFIISAENRSYREIFNWMAHGFGKKHPSRKAGPFLAGMAWRKEKIKSRFTRNRPLDYAGIGGNCSRAKFVMTIKNCSRPFLHSVSVPWKIPFLKPVQIS